MAYSCSAYFAFTFKKPIKWDVILETEVLKFKAKIQQGWHLYAVYVPNPNEGPLPTSFSFKTNEKYILTDSIIQEKPIIKYDKNYGVELAYYEQEATFLQK